tara:strand:+ start:336 stop:899 length:564 start_codon:yes stop_codon:yes gene_type:complete
MVEQTKAVEKKTKKGPAPVLTDRQKKFCEFIVFGDPKDGTPLSGAEAAYRAGYRTRPRQAASELQNKKIYPLAVKYRDELKEDLIQKWGINYGKHIEDLGRLRDRSSKLTQMSAAITAEKNRGQASGLYVERKQIITTKVDFDSMSPKEINDYIDGMYKEDTKSDMKNVTPTEATKESELGSNPESD